MRRLLMTLAGTTMLVVPAVIAQALFASPSRADFVIYCSGLDPTMCGGINPGGNDPAPDPPDPCQQLPHPDCSRDGDDVPHRFPHTPHPHPIPFPRNQGIDPSKILNPGPQ